MHGFDQATYNVFKCFHNSTRLSENLLYLGHAKLIFGYSVPRPSYEKCVNSNF